MSIGGRWPSASRQWPSDIDMIPATGINLHVIDVEQIPCHVPLY